MVVVMSDDDLPIAIDDLPTRVPWWPYSPWATRHRIRTGRMAAIRDGRRLYLRKRVNAKRKAFGYTAA